MAYEPRGDHRHGADKGFNRNAAGEDGGAPRARGRREYFGDSLLPLPSRLLSTALPHVSRDALFGRVDLQVPDQLHLPAHRLSLFDAM